MLCWTAQTPSFSCHFCLMNFLSTLKCSSIGLKSGKYSGRSSNTTPASRHICIIFAEWCQDTEVGQLVYKAATIKTVLSPYQCWSSLKQDSQSRQPLNYPSPTSCPRHRPIGSGGLMMRVGRQISRSGTLNLDNNELLPSGEVKSA
jgi:hypothetical protein